MNDNTNVPDWVRFTSNGLFIVAIIVGGVFVAYAGGCQAVTDGLAWVIGAPTSTDMKAAETKLGDAEAAANEADRQARTMEASIVAAANDASEADARKDQIRSMYASAAGQMADLDGAAADAMIGVMDALQTELHRAKDDAAAAAAIVATYQGRVAEHLAAADRARELARRHAAELAGLDEQAAIAVARAVDTVKLAGTMAGNFGVPAGGAMGDVGGDMVGGLLGLLGIGGAGAGMVRSRRERKRADFQESEATWAKDVIVMTEKMGLIRTDDGADRAKGVARSELGEAVVAKMNALVGTVRKPVATP